MNTAQSPTPMIISYRFNDGIERKIATFSNFVVLKKIEEGIVEDRVAFIHKHAGGDIDRLIDAQAKAPSLQEVLASVYSFSGMARGVVAGLLVANPTLSRADAELFANNIADIITICRAMAPQSGDQPEAFAATSNPETTAAA